MGAIREFLRRVRREATLPERKPSSMVQIGTDIDQLNYRLRCTMTLGGYKHKPPEIKDDAELKKLSDEGVTKVANVLLMLRCAEDVITRHGIEREYQKQVEEAQIALTKMIKARFSGVYDAIEQAIKKAGIAEMRQREGLGDAEHPEAGGTPLADAEGEPEPLGGMALGEGTGDGAGKN